MEIKIPIFAVAVSVSIASIGDRTRRNAPKRGKNQSMLLMKRRENVNIMPTGNLCNLSNASCFAKTVLRLCVQPAISAIASQSKMYFPNRNHHYKWGRRRNDDSVAAFIVRPCLIFITCEIPSKQKFHPSPRCTSFKFWFSFSSLRFLLFAVLYPLMVDILLKKGFSFLSNIFWCLLQISKGILAGPVKNQDTNGCNSLYKTASAEDNLPEYKKYISSENHSTNQRTRRNENEIEDVKECFFPPRKKFQGRQQKKENNLFLLRKI